MSVLSETSPSFPARRDRKPLLIIKPRKGWQLVDIREFAEYRDLFFFLVLRDVKVRYKQTVLGGLWAIIQPVFTMVIFTLFFGNLAKVPSDGIPYPIFSFSALVAWTYFANTVSFSSNSIVQEANLISKVYFPRLIVPLVPAVAFLLDLAIAFVVLLVMMAAYGIYPNTNVVFLPALVALMLLTASGVGMILAALSVRYRDVRYAVTFSVQLWMFASPVAYPASMVPERFRLIYAMNPMTGVIEGFRSALLGSTPFPTGMVLISSCVAIGLFAIGVSYFKQIDRYFADVI